MIEQDDENEGQARFKIAKGFDFAQTVNWKLFEAMHLPRRSTKRAEAVKDLEVLLSFDAEGDKTYNAAVDALKPEVQPNGSKVITNVEGFSDGMLRILIGLIKRKGYGGGTDADIEDEL